MVTAVAMGDMMLPAKKSQVKAKQTRRNTTVYLLQPRYSIHRSHSWHNVELSELWKVQRPDESITANAGSLALSYLGWAC